MSLAAFYSRFLGALSFFVVAVVTGIHFDPVGHAYAIVAASLGAPWIGMALGAIVVPR